MKILAMSDIHGNYKAVQKILEDSDLQNTDIVLICGDITHFGSIAQTENILHDITKYGVPTYFVPGNCDNTGVITKKELGRAINIHGKTIKANQLLVAGIGGAPITPFSTNIELSEDEFEKIIDRLKKEVLSTNWILCAHSPPFGTAIDLLFNGMHAGSKAIFKFIENYKPLVSIHGHIHEARGIDKIGDTPILNLGPARSKYCAIIEITSSKKSKIKIDLKRA